MMIIITNKNDAKNDTSDYIIKYTDYMIRVLEDKV